MKNFRINSQDDPEVVSATTTEVMPGTRFTFRNIGGQIKAAMSIPVTIIT